MREMDWPADAPKAGRLVGRDDLLIVRERLGGGTLISGNLAAAISVLAPGAPMLGLGAECSTSPFAVRIARDRALLVSDMPLDVPAGWQKEAYAATPADDVWTTFTASGHHARTMVAEAIAADPDSGSPSAAVRGPGINCLLLRRGGSFVWFVETSLAWYFADWLREAASAVVE